MLFVGHQCQVREDLLRIWVKALIRQHANVHIVYAGPEVKMRRLNLCSLKCLVTQRPSPMQDNGTSDASAPVSLISWLVTNSWNVSGGQRTDLSRCALILGRIYLQSDVKRPCRVRLVRCLRPNK